MSKILLLNAPKNVGKSVAVKYLRSLGIDLVSAECKESLHNLTMTLFGVDPSRYWEIYNTRELKEVPLPEFRLIDIDMEILSDVLDYDLHHWSNPWRNKTFTSCNLSIREAMIYVSEVVIKPRWGQDWFGKERVRKITSWKGIDDQWLPSDIVFVDDSTAFVDELVPLIDHIGQENILLLRIHRQGFTFEGDSRNYIPNGVIANTRDIYNDGTEAQFLEEVGHIVKRWL